MDLDFWKNETLEVLVSCIQTSYVDHCRAFDKVDTGHYKTYISYRYGLSFDIPRFNIILELPCKPFLEYQESILRIDLEKINSIEGIRERIKIEQFRVKKYQALWKGQMEYSMRRLKDAPKFSEKWEKEANRAVLKKKNHTPESWMNQHLLAMNEEYHFVDVILTTLIGELEVVLSAMEDQLIIYEKDIKPKKKTHWPKVLVDYMRALENGDPSFEGKKTLIEFGHQARPEIKRYHRIYYDNVSKKKHDLPTLERAIQDLDHSDSKYLDDLNYLKKKLTGFN